MEKKHPFIVFEVANKRIQSRHMKKDLLQALFGATGA